MSKEKLLKKVVVVILMVLLILELAPSGENFDLALVPDMHFGGFVSQQYAITAIRKANKAKKVCFLGDLTETHAGDKNQFDEALSAITFGLAVPYKAIRGNHDQKFLFETYFGPTHWVWDTDEFRLIGIDTNEPDLAFIEEAFQTKKPCLILGHHNIELVKSPARDKLRQLMKKYRVLAYISGHLHFNLVRKDSFTGAWLIMCGWGQIGQVTFLSIRDGKIIKIDCQ